jgi:hypothetical protein
MQTSTEKQPKSIVTFEFEKTKNITAWSEAEAVMKMCQYIDKVAPGWEQDWEEVYKIFNEERVHYSSEESGFLTSGKGEYSHGMSSKHPDGYSYLFEILDQQDSEKHFGKFVFKFYVYIKQWEEKKENI